MMQYGQIEQEWFGDDGRSLYRSRHPLNSMTDFQEVEVSNQIYQAEPPKASVASTKHTLLEVAIALLTPDK
ncbi:hypothetical protein IFO70_28370 [Phormidium tenue FACHB-886]|nr:hypothetical protein [Phormidium tenue FACHB-886]